MKFKTADDAARDYLRLKARFSAPAPQSLTVTAGYGFAEKCPHDQTTERFVGADGSTWRCRKCGRPWPIEEAEVPRQPGMGGRRETEDHLVMFATLGALLRRLGVWQRRTLLLYAPGDLSIEAVAHEGAQSWPRRVDAWTVYRVRADLRDARERMERLLRAGGLLKE